MLVETSPFFRFYNFLAKMGLVLHDDPPKIIDLTGREWGETVDGLALSVRELPRQDSEGVAGISVVLRNTGGAPKTLSVPSWVRYYEIAGLELSPYGRQLMTGDASARAGEVNLSPGEAVETELPIAKIYDLRKSGTYSIQVSSKLPDGAVLKSNAIEIRV